MRVILSVIFCFTLIALQAQTSCEFPLDNGPLTRLVTPSEDNIKSGLYDAVAQRFNNVDATISSVTFWARTNPANTNGDVSNVVTIKIYYINPSSGGINGAKIANAETQVVVDTSATHDEYIATFSPTIPVSDTNIMIMIEGASPSTDDFFVKRSSNGDGGNLKLILIKQGTWFNNLSLGGGFDYDYQIVPSEILTVNAAFAYSVSNDTVSFTNGSTGATSYVWDFGDGDTSHAINPVHVFGSSDTFQVKLTAYAPGGFCFNDETQPVIVSLVSGIASQTRVTSVKVQTDMERKQLIISTRKNLSYQVFDVTGMALKKGVLGPGMSIVDLSDLPAGIYFLQADPQAEAHRIVIPK
jgi:PKD repeat protein